MPKQHLIKYHDTEEAQMAYCKSIGCYYECEWCVGYSESMPKLVPYKKAKIIETKVEANEFDNLAQNVVKTKKYGDFDHPLYKEILRLFIK
tara:strand:+ start:3791 stop:4063 length:273 start_codon:yes stop_codon:yes gene_type:complete